MTSYKNKPAIVIVDDSETNHTSIKTSLLIDKKAYYILDFYNGEEAVKGRKRIKGPCLIILDYQMPGKLSGAEACMAIRQYEATQVARHPDFPYACIFTFTQMRDRSDRSIFTMEGCYIGANYNLSKPFNPADAEFVWQAFEEHIANHCPPPTEEQFQFLK